LKVFNSIFEKILAIAFFVIALAFLVVGNLRSFQVYDTDAEEFGLESFDKINERSLVIDATFTGTIRKGNKLYSTYDRTVKGGKRPCPT